MTLCYENVPLPEHVSKLYTDQQVRAWMFAVGGCASEIHFLDAARDRDITAKPQVVNRVVFHTIDTPGIAHGNRASESYAGSYGRSIKSL